MSTPLTANLGTVIIDDSVLESMALREIIDILENYSREINSTKFFKKELLSSFGVPLAIFSDGTSGEISGWKTHVSLDYARLGK